MPKFMIPRVVSNRRIHIVNARRRILIGVQTISPALVTIINKKQLTIKSSGASRWQGLSRNNNLVPICAENGDREPQEKKPITLLVNEFLDELGEIPGSIPLKDFPTHKSLPKNMSPINFDFKTNDGADLLTRKTQHLLRDIYSMYNSTAYYSLEIVQRAHWLDASKKFEFTMRAKREIENNYLRYWAILKHNCEKEANRNNLLLVLLVFL